MFSVHVEQHPVTRRVHWNLCSFSIPEKFIPFAASLCFLESFICLSISPGNDLDTSLAFWS